jgi:hypothetical protein
MSGAARLACLFFDCRCAELGCRDALPYLGCDASFTLSLGTAKQVPLVQRDVFIQ